MRGLNRSIAALLALLLILCIAVPEMADAAMLRQGSSGEQVKTLQSKLKRTLCSSLFFASIYICLRTTRYSSPLR